MAEHVLLFRGGLGNAVAGGAIALEEKKESTGPILLTQALVPLLQAGRPARVINVSSRLGSMHDMGDGWAGYGISKAAAW